MGNFLEVVDPNYNQSLKDIKMLLCGFSPNNLIHLSAIMDKEVDSIKIYPKERRVDLRWVHKSSEPIWIVVDDGSNSGWLGLDDNFDSIWSDSDESFYIRSKRRRVSREIFFIQKGKIDIQGISDEIAVRSFNRIYILNNSEFYKYLLSVLEKIELCSINEKRYIIEILKYIFIDFSKSKILDIKLIEKSIENVFDSIRSKVVEKEVLTLIDRTELIRAIQNTNWKIFDPSVWSRKEE